MFTCSFCSNAKFAGQAAFTDHIRSEDHRQNIVKSQHLLELRQTPVVSIPNSTHQCDPCGKRFVGEVPYKQHLASEKHKKKMNAMSIIDSDAQSTTNTNFLSCEPCGKKFAGPTPYSQHIISEKHIKKMREVQTSPVTNRTTSTVGDLSCTLCNVSCESQEDFIKHTSSPDHRVRVLENNEKGITNNAPTEEEKKDKDLVIKIIANHKRDFFVCPADVAFVDFAKKLNLLS